MWVKDIDSGEVVDHEPSYIKAWPGSFVAAERPKTKVKKAAEPKADPQSAEVD